jgi:hypothetical protein
MNDHAARPFDVFLSHSAEERAIAEEVQDYLGSCDGVELRDLMSASNKGTARKRRRKPKRKCRADKVGA